MSILDQDQLGAFCRHTHVELKGAASGALAGLTFGLKDIFDVAGHKTGFGCPDWLRTHEAAKVHAPVTQKLLDAGAHLIGKTHTEEMAFSLTGENAHYGTPKNVAAPGRVPGGSSSGSAAAVAGKLCDFAIGSDTGGSVRGPASFCGIYGIRPTHGRISLEHVCPLAPGFDTCGWFARDAALLARVGEVLLGGKAAAPGRVLLAEDAYALATPEAQQALRPAIARVEKVLGKAEPVTVSAEGLNNWFEVFRILQFAEIWDTHREWVTREKPNFGIAIGKRFEAVQKVTAAEVAQAIPQREELAARLDKLLANNAVLVLPTVPDIAPLVNCPHDQTTAFRERAMGMLCISGIGRLPQVNLPLATLNGCPLGLSIVAARGNDEMLLSIAKNVQ
ncbi:MAG: amidase [Betaproteobacteria bacterium]|nr:amidase [Betaproteobacteria bacterium]